MNINAVPVEAYRQAANQPSRKEAAGQEAFTLDRATNPKSIRLPAFAEAEAGSIKANHSPSFLSGVLSSEENDELIRHFARFGDSQTSSQIYGTDAQTRAVALKGLKVDVTG